MCQKWLAKKIRTDTFHLLLWLLCRLVSVVWVVYYFVRRNRTDFFVFVASVFFEPHEKDEDDNVDFVGPEFENGDVYPENDADARGDVLVVAEETTGAHRSSR
mmetsp:Transcript_54175/g.131465  ORF Transcript_54175/g.131465 Transcript_54175/m.131465 type:complete len:103 (-) Transcript_54175:930-1238(-)